ncbi:ATP-binding protein [Magnetovibrio sp. PR-2]|uniref:sensor histidine kinase n=1 Tax=Magnetovibrio sp. PR-2 TaxID=3120356 RepID=UPI002FCDE7F1
MAEFKDVKRLRNRYIIALSAIAMLATGTWLSMQAVVDHQRNYSHLMTIAGNQNGLSERISHFSALMVHTHDEEEFQIAKSQLGRAISKLKASHKILLLGDEESGIPRIQTDILKAIYFDPTVGLDMALERYLDHARTIYDMPQSELKHNTGSLVFLQQYGPYVLDAMFTAASDEYENVSRQAIDRIKRIETILWIVTLSILGIEAYFIFRPLEGQLRQSLNELTQSNHELVTHLAASRRDREELSNAHKSLEQLNDHLEMRIDIRTRELSRELERHKQTEARLLHSKTELENANRAKSEFLANMSHELRTPLNAIIGFSNMLRTEVFGQLTNPKQREYIDDIHHSGNHLLELINDILDVSALEVGKIELHEDLIDMKEVAGRVLRIVMPHATTKGIRLLHHITTPFPKLGADERRVKQILINLLTNAIKFTPKGGTVELDFYQTLSGGIGFSISDTGIGMDAQELEHAMSMFGQVDSVFSRTEQGTGLGLPLCKGLVDLHGGNFQIKSHKGSGTHVSVHFPAERTTPRRLDVETAHGVEDAEIA